MNKLNEVPAFVVEHGERHQFCFGRRRRKHDASLLQPLLLPLDVLDKEGRRRNAILVYRLLEGFGRGVDIRLEE